MATRKELEQYQQNLAKLKEQAAFYGMAVPLELANNIHYHEQKIQELQAALSPPETALPASTEKPSGRQSGSSDRSGSFWRTAAGLRLGIAVLVIAVGGCIAIFVAMPKLLDLGFGPSANTPSLTATTTAVPAALPDAATPTQASISPPASSVDLSLPVQLPDGDTVLIVDPAANKFRYSILSAQREPLSPGKYLLRLHIQVWNHGIGGMNFWDDSFRLKANNLQLTPISKLNIVVGRDETAEGDVEFEVDASVKEASLVINVHRSDDSASQTLRLILP